MSTPYEYLFKLLIIGDSGVGKSSLLIRYAEDTFVQNYITTIGVDFRIKSLDINGERIKLQIWDTAGQERFRTITTTYYRGTYGVIVVYDITDPESFVHVENWVEEIKRNCEDVPCILIGNKLDMESDRVVKTQDGERLAQQYQMDFLEASALNNMNVGKIFEVLAKKILSHTKNERPLNTRRIKGDDFKPKPRPKPCCN
ncbi:hypothetical protein SNEBB_010105 [Seison nebaliae]|nr:hypothetical protein SNEBB_010105 [Seison nebaliae]